MNKTILILTSSLLISFGASLSGASACCPAPAAGPGAAPPGVPVSPERLVLNTYEKVALALAADNLPEALRATRTLAVIGDMASQREVAKTAREMLKADSLEKAREKFKLVSAGAVKLALKEDGFYIMNCPTGGKEAVWAQSNREIRNPYYGSKALGCGIIRAEGRTPPADSKKAS